MQPPFEILFSDLFPIFMLEAATSMLNEKKRFNSGCAGRTVLRRGNFQGHIQ
jgi:hypothetical protein